MQKGPYTRTVSGGVPKSQNPKPDRKDAAEEGRCAFSVTSLHPLLYPFFLPGCFFFPFFLSSSSSSLMKSASLRKRPGGMIAFILKEKTLAGP